jgi:hypothetical protein
MAKAVPPLPRLARSLEKYNVAKLLRTTTDALGARICPDVPPGERHEVVRCFCAVLEAHVYGYRYGATKIALAAGLSRTNAWRRLKPLVASGKLLRERRTYAINHSWANSPEGQEAFAAVMAHVHERMREIEHASNLDTLLEKTPNANAPAVLRSYLDVLPS